MNEVVLVTGSESLTGRKLIEKLLARGAQVIAPVAGRETGASETGTPNLTVVTWNRSSWFSAKAVVREAVRKHGALTSAWLLHQSQPGLPDFSEAGSADIETMLEQSVKGTLALTREILPVLESGGGFFGMVVPYRSGGAPGPLESLSQGAFTGFAGSLLQSLGPSLWAAGFSCGSPDADGFASAILQLGDERPRKLRGRWYRYAEGRRPFSGSSFSDSII